MLVLLFYFFLIHITKRIKSSLLKKQIFYIV